MTRNSSLPKAIILTGFWFDDSGLHLRTKDCTAKKENLEVERSSTGSANSEFDFEIKFVYGQGVTPSSCSEVLQLDYSPKELSALGIGFGKRFLIRNPVRR